MEQPSNVKVIEMNVNFESNVNILTKSTDNLYINKDCVKNEDSDEKYCKILSNDSTKMLVDEITNLHIAKSNEKITEGNISSQNIEEKNMSFDGKLHPSTSFETYDTDSIFEIDDFTTVTESEKLAAQFDFILRKHKISRLNSEGCKKRILLSNNISWKKEEDIIDYDNGKLSVVFTYLSSFPEPINDSPIQISEEDGKEYFEIDIGKVSDFYEDKYFNIENDMSFAKAYGIYGAIWISPTSNYISSFNLTEIKQVLSSIGLFDKQYGCCVPIFCSSDIYTPWRGLGVFLENDKRIDFLNASLTKPPISLRYLNGLKELFIGKVNISSHFPVDVFVTIKTRYNIYSEQEYDYKVDIQNIFKTNKFIEYLKEDQCFFKICPKYDPLKEIRLYAELSNLSTDLINESPLFSDLDPKMTSKWFLEVLFNDNNIGFLYKTFLILVEYHSKYSNTQKIPDWYCKEKLYRNIPYDITNEDGKDDLNVINKSRLIFFETTDDDFNTNNKKSILQQLPQRIVEYVFDTCNLNKNFPKQNSQRISNYSDDEYEKIGNWKNFMLEDIDKYKSSKTFSLSEQISIIIVKCLNIPYDDSYRLACYVWMEFVNLLGKYFDDAIDIPGTECNTEPNFNDCKLQQLLQLLQCCIDAKKRWYNYYESDDFNNHDYDEFHDAEEEFQNIDYSRINNHKEERKPLGRSHPVQGNLRLLNYDDRIMYVPFLQYPAPITEEQFDNQLSEDTELSRNERIKRQIIVLKSDMSAFKAANPGCCFEDFVRWHSPNDWTLDEESGTYTLSQRMTDTDNIWQLTWKEAPIEAITEQEHIFNETIEAYKILDTLKNINIKELINLIIPCNIKVGFKTLVKNVPLKDKYSQQKLKNLQQYLIKSLSLNQQDVLMEFIRNLRIIQNSIFQYNSLKELFSQFNNNLSKDEQECIEDLVIKLMNHNSSIDTDEEEHTSLKVPILGGPKGFIGQIICQLANMGENINEGTSFPEPEVKEYLLKCKCKRPHLGSRECNNRMYTIVDDDIVSWYLSISSDIFSA
ncbi:Rab3 GTPase-activating protein catalytic subunit [Strongyloides ratti]|uniref:Rab3 GTPase-activating protein catalytic subunit n=1 Tax=Strongyloides ratti TaxID=34506 RepID=A0A090KPS9_STRRB|nr:Rab3 GTPase-activating protein catalytic subunit [Strongyloides ratti]CEF59389.1 Rab3 GTPase-activating protein catalytic subunit [Strongyloides ratti]